MEQKMKAMEERVQDKLNVILEERCEKIYEKLEETDKKINAVQVER